MSRVIPFLLAACAALLAACAKLDYIKVPSPTQYAKWTDDDQRRADAMKGVRYSLPRPFPHFKQSMPVAQRAAFISFRYRPKSEQDPAGYYLELRADAPTWLRRVAPQHFSVTQALAAMVMHAPEDEKDRDEAATAGGEPEAETPEPGPATDAPPSELTAETGFINGTDPGTRLSDRMDVV